jgi:peptide deformylase
MFKLQFSPKSILREVSAPVTPKGSPNWMQALSLKNDMVEMSKRLKAAGLAAIQIGIPLRACTILNNDKESTYTFCLNPEITKRSGQAKPMNEGCLSLPGVSCKVNRNNKITVKYFNESGEEVTEDVEGVKAQIFQHEIDHMNGKLYTDNLGPMKRDIILTKYKKLRKRIDRYVRSRK